MLGQAVLMVMLMTDLQICNSFVESYLIQQTLSSLFVALRSLHSILSHPPPSLPSMSVVAKTMIVTILKVDNGCGVDFAR